MRPTTDRTQGAAMLDLGTSFLASVARDPEALAIVDADVRLSYRAWYGKISALVAGLDSLGLKPGYHLVTVLQNRWEAATIQWACQFAGIIMTPLNWRSTAQELDFCLQDAEAKAIVYEEVSAAAVRSSDQARSRARIAVGEALAQDLPFESLIGANAAGVRPRVGAEAWSVMLYTSATTARPTPWPRPHRHARSAGRAASRSPRSRMSRRISTRRTSARSAPCRSTTPWVCARSLPCR